MIIFFQNVITLRKYHAVIARYQHSRILSDKDYPGALVFMKNVAKHLVPEFSVDILPEFFSSIEGFKEVIPILKRAIDMGLAKEITFTLKDKDLLKTIVPVATYIQDKEAQMKSSGGALEQTHKNDPVLEKPTKGSDALDPLVLKQDLKKIRNNRRQQVVGEGEDEGGDGPHVH